MRQLASQLAVMDEQLRDGGDAGPARGPRPKATSAPEGKSGMFPVAWPSPSSRADYEAP